MNLVKRDRRPVSILCAVATPIPIILPLYHSKYSTMTLLSSATAPASPMHQVPMALNGAKRQDFYIPSVNIAPFLKDPRSAEAKTIIDDVRAACQSTGFFQITGHGISKNLQQDVFEAGKRFFKLPYEEKKELDASKHAGHRGYDVLASQAYSEGLLPDLKEVRLSVPPYSKVSGSLRYCAQQGIRASTSASTIPPATPAPAASSQAPTSGRRLPSFHPPSFAHPARNTTQKCFPSHSRSCIYSLQHFHTVPTSSTLSYLTTLQPLCVSSTTPYPKSPLRKGKT